MTLGGFTAGEISTQPEAWAAGLEVLAARQQDLASFWRKGGYDQVVFIGCGSTYYLALSAATLVQTLTDVPARGLPSSEVWLSTPSFISNRRTLLVAISRSGATTETLRACETFREEHGTALLTLSCYPDAPLASLGDLNLVLPSGQEQSVAQTRSFSTLFLSTTALATIWGGSRDVRGNLGRLPALCRAVLDSPSLQAVRDLGRDPALDRFYFLGSGPRYGLACELSLKMKEMSLSHSEPFHFMEFRHGPMSMAAGSALLVGLVSESNRSYETRVLDEMRAHGAHVLAIGEHDLDVALESHLDDLLRNSLYLPVGQTLALEHALSKMLNPDAPANLGAVVRLPS